MVQKGTWELVSKIWTSLGEFVFSRARASPNNQKAMDSILGSLAHFNEN